MIVKFLSVSAHNFRSFKQFELVLDQGGLTLVQGKIEGGSETLESNGAGKSSLFSAVSWALFGKFVHVSGLKVSGDKIVRRGSTEGSSVSVTLLAEKDLVVIERFRGHPVFGDKIRLFINDKEETQSSNPKTQQLIESVIGISFDLFVNLIYVSEASLRESFAFESDANRKKILVGALPQFQQFGRARVKVKDSLDKFSDFSRKIGMEHAAYTKALQELGNDFSEVDTERIQTRIEELKIECEQHHQSVASLRAQLNLVKGDLDSSETGVELESQLQAVTELYNHYRQNLANLNAAIQTFVSQIQKWNSLGLKCPTCEQGVSEEFKDVRVVDLQEQVGRLEIDKAEIESRLNELSAKRSYIENQRDQIRNQRSKLQAKIAFLSTSIESTLDIVTVKENEFKQLHSIGQNLDQARKIAGQKQEMIRSRVRELETLSTVTRNFESALKGWLDGFGPRGVLALGLNHVVEVLTQKTEHWLWKLWHEGASFQFEFVGDDLSKIEARLFLNQELVDVESLSSGETRRLCLAICFGLRETLQVLTGWISNLLVLDEVFDGLDGVGRIKVLREMKTLDNTSVFVISQFPQLSEEIDRTAEVTFSLGNSTLHISETT